MQKLAERFVFGVANVSVAILLTLERKDEAVSEPFIVILFADVRAPFESNNLRDLRFEVTKSGLDLLDIVSRSRGFEFEADNVFELFSSGCGHGDCEKG